MGSHYKGTTEIERLRREAREQYQNERWRVTTQKCPECGTEWPAVRSPTAPPSICPRADCAKRARDLAALPVKEERGG